MGEISFVGPSRCEISISGIDAGSGQGKMTIKGDQGVVSLTNLTFKRAPSGDEEAQKLQEEIEQMRSMWTSIRTGQGEILVHTPQLEAALLHALPHDEQGKAVTAIVQRVLTPSPEAAFVVPDWHAVQEVLTNEAFALHMKAELQQQRRTLPEHIGKEELERLQKESIERSQQQAERDVAVVIDWLRQHGGAFAEECVRTRCDKKVEQRLPFAIRAVRDPRSGKISMYISIGILGKGIEKSVKAVVRISDGDVGLFVRPAPRKEGDVPARIEARRCNIKAECALLQTLKDQGVPHIPKVIAIAYPRKGGGVRQEYLIERFEDTVEDRLSQLFIDHEPDHDDRSNFLLPMALRILESLAALARAGWAHLDLKPQNLFLKDIDVYIADFGFASRLQSTRFARGTPGYMAPEMFEAIDKVHVSGALDMWSFGVVLASLYDGGIEDVPWNVTQHELLEMHAALDRLEEQAEEARKKGDRHGEEYACEEIAKYKVAIHNKLEEMKNMVRVFQGEQRNQHDPVCDLIADLVDLDPARRPTADQAHARLQQICTTIYAQQGEQP